MGGSYNDKVINAFTGLEASTAMRSALGQGSGADFADKAFLEELYLAATKQANPPNYTGNPKTLSELSTHNIFNEFAALTSQGALTTDEKAALIRWIGELDNLDLIHDSKSEHLDSIEKTKKLLSKQERSAADIQVQGDWPKNPSALGLEGFVFNRVHMGKNPGSDDIEKGKVKFIFSAKHAGLFDAEPKGFITLVGNIGFMSNLREQESAAKINYFAGPEVKIALALSILNKVRLRNGGKPVNVPDITVAAELIKTNMPLHKVIHSVPVTPEVKLAAYVDLEKLAKEEKLSKIVGAGDADNTKGFPSLLPLSKATDMDNPLGAIARMHGNTDAFDKAVKTNGVIACIFGGTLNPPTTAHIEMLYTTALWYHRNHPGEAVDIIVNTVYKQVLSDPSKAKSADLLYLQLKDESEYEQSFQHRFNMTIRMVKIVEDKLRQTLGAAYAECTVRISASDCEREIIKKPRMEDLTGGVGTLEQLKYITGNYERNYSIAANHVRGHFATGQDSVDGFTLGGWVNSARMIRSFERFLIFRRAMTNASGQETYLPTPLSDQSDQILRKDFIESITIVSRADYEKLAQADKEKYLCPPWNRPEHASDPSYFATLKGALLEAAAQGKFVDCPLTPQQKKAMQGVSSSKVRAHLERYFAAGGHKNPTNLQALNQHLHPEIASYLLFEGNDIAPYYHMGDAKERVESLKQQESAANVISTAATNEKFTPGAAAAMGANRQVGGKSAVPPPGSASGPAPKKPK